MDKCKINIFSFSFIQVDYRVKRSVKHQTRFHRSTAKGIFDKCCGLFTNKIDFDKVIAVKSICVRWKLIKLGKE